MMIPTKTIFKIIPQSSFYETLVDKLPC